ncbi:M23 family metallopeptidase [Leucobacter sp. W1153]|uniref:M23 family metallopeptidase n=1 Tax=Leucobacter sp. W1153 TaxID=3439064 RepID=UPI003F507BA0
MPNSGPRRRQKRFIATPAAIVGVGALMLTMALPGVHFGESEESVAAMQAQLLNTGGTSDLSSSFDALNSVIVEAGESDGSFINYVDAEIQFPFAQSVPLTDPFGERHWPVAGFHDAQDFAAPDGTTIQSIAEGVVIEAGYANDGCGFGLKVKHVIDDSDVTARYCHMQMNSHDHEVGDKLRVGDPVGRVGNTGLSFGSHLHFALTVDGEAVDPMPFLLKYNRLTRTAP